MSLRPARSLVNTSRKTVEGGVRIVDTRASVRRLAASIEDVMCRNYGTGHAQV
jgi:hypothetical protein